VLVLSSIKGKIKWEELKDIAGTTFQHLIPRYFPLVAWFDDQMMKNG